MINLPDSASVPDSPSSTSRTCGEPAKARMSPSTWRSPDDSRRPPSPMLSDHLAGNRSRKLENPRSSSLENPDP